MSLRFGMICVIGLVVGCAQAEPGEGAGELDSANYYPCDIADILNRKCFQCHGEVPVGVPMSLVNPDVIFTNSVTAAGAGRMMGHVFSERINSPNRPMPPLRDAMNGPLTDAEKTRLNDWLFLGARAGGPEAAACQPVPPPGGGGMGGATNPGAGGSQWGAGGYVAPPPGAGGTWSAGGAPPPGGGGTYLGAGGSVGGAGGSIVGGAGGEGGITNTPREPFPGECNYVQIRARAAGAAAPGTTTGAPYPVPSNYIDKYICFEFDLALPGPTHALQFKSVVPDQSYVHHWLLYRKRAGVGANNGANTECLGLHPDAELMAGWAPGAGDWNLPGHVGMDMGSGKYILEIHYNNLAAAKQDNSGVDVCITPNLRQETAGIHWLGSEFLTLPPNQPRDEVSMCRPVNQTQPINILRWWPHMHKLGTNMKADIYRQGGGVETILDEPFDFYNQIQYDRPSVINPGDSILTTCSFFNNTPGMVLFGESTLAEMCYNFVVAYPANSLVSALQGIHSNSCQGPP